jgi:hypothetical protein
LIFEDDIAARGAEALGPVEPPPQGDVELAFVREKYGDQPTLFGNLEIGDLENLPSEDFAQKVKSGLEEATFGKGKGFVLMPSSCTCERELSTKTISNYEIMSELAENFL